LSPLASTEDVSFVKETPVKYLHSVWTFEVKKHIGQIELLMSSHEYLSTWFGEILLAQNFSMFSGFLLNLGSFVH
jgi:hypothetical protein